MEWKNSKVGTNLGVIFPSEANLNELQDILSPRVEHLGKKYFMNPSNFNLNQNQINS